MEKKMHPKVLSPDAWRTVRRLCAAKLLDGWTLAGETGLALQMGHRYSEDLDLFRPEEFDPVQLVNKLPQTGTVNVQDRSASTLHVLVEGTRFSFLRIQPPLIFNGTPYRGLTVADPRDIAVLKIVAIGGRGSWKDFVDLHFYLKAAGGLEPLFTLLHKRFAGIDFNEYHLLKSLVYFNDAEAEPMPEMIKKVSWEEIKAGIADEVRRI